MRFKRRVKLRPNDPPTRNWFPLKRGPDWGGMEFWSNRYYTVVKALYDNGMIRLGISNIAQSARRDWREFQQIKNELAGPEWEAVELYPAESRVVDPSNYFYLWCFPDRFPFGIDLGAPKRVSAADAIAPQRELGEL